MTNFNELFSQDLNSIRSGLVDAPNQYGETALSYVVSHCNDYPSNATSLASFLLSMGANITLPGHYGQTPIEQAIASKCDLSMVQLLHQAGGNLPNAADLSFFSKLSAPVAKYIIENSEVDCGRSAAARFCDKKLFDQSVFEAYTDKCITPEVIQEEGGFRAAIKTMDLIDPVMVASYACRYHAEPNSEVSFLTSQALAFPDDFAKNYAGCAEVVGSVTVVHDGQLTTGC